MNTTTADTESETFTEQPEQPKQRQLSQIRRSGEDKMLGGVAGGIARYLDVDVTLVRVVIAVLAMFTFAPVGLYVSAWVLIPADGEDQSIAAAWIASRRDRSAQS
jgi:phage shock protein PspC (stress-responsive transcriptional regulator)